MKKAFSLLLYFSLSLILFQGIGHPVQMSAQSKSKKVLKLEEERNNLLKSIKKTEKEIQGIRNNVSKKKKEAQLLKRQVKERTRLVEVLDQEVKTLSLEIDSLQSRIEILSDKEKKCMDAYARSAQALQRRKNKTDRLLFLLSSQSFNQAVRRMRFISQYAQAHDNAAKELRKTREEIVEIQRHVQFNREEKSKVLALREQERNTLRKQEQSTQKEVTSLSAQQKELERKQNKQKKRAKQLEAQIQKQIALEIAEAERKAREEQERLEREARSKGKVVSSRKGRKAETKGGYAMNESERTLAKTFAANKGKLPPPVNGSYQITRGFGINQHNSLSHVQTSNGGIDLTVSSGTSAIAVFDGVVSKVFVLPGYNTSIILRHGNYLTVYTNLINVSVQAGQKVKTGHKLGLIAEDQETGKCTLQFQVWHERQKTNPELWIR